MNMTEVVEAITHAQYRLDYDTFVQKVLNGKPREGDRWQEEQWEHFQGLASALNRLAIGTVEKIIEQGQR